MDINTENENEIEGEQQQKDTRMSIDNKEENLNVQQNYAGFWIRFWAYTMDLVIVFSLNGLLLSPLLFTGTNQIDVFGFFTLQGILTAFTTYIYFLLMTKWLGQTLGKMVMGLKVVRKDATTPGWSDLIFREVIGRFIHRSLVITNIMYIVVGFTDQKQGVHDTFGDTRVIHVEK